MRLFSIFQLGIKVRWPLNALMGVAWRLFRLFVSVKLRFGRTSLFVIPSCRRAGGGESYRLNHAWCSVGEVLHSDPRLGPRDAGS